MSASRSASASIRLNRIDWGWIVLAVAAAAASLWIAHRYFQRAFPEAGIDFRVSRHGSASIAENFLRQQGIAVGGLWHAARFSYDDTAKVFLERELGPRHADPLLSSRVHLWRWENRWFLPLHVEEVRVAVTPAGQVVGFDHIIAKDAPGASLTQAAARQRAQAFLTQVMGLDPATLTLVSAERRLLPHRIDYTFTWKDAAPLVAGTSNGYLQAASYRRQVRIQGDRIGSYREFVYVPDSWQRAYARLRARNNTTGEIDTVLFMVLGVALVVVLIRRARWGDIRWRPAKWVGLTGAALTFLAVCNGLPASLFDYSTTDSFGAWLGHGIVNALLAAAGAGVLLALLTAAGEPLYRERFPRLLSLRSYLSWRGLRTKSFFLSVVLGIALAFVFLAYQTIFYIIAHHFGAWAPADVPYDSLLNSRFPWIFVLLGGFFPAISEEFMFRMGAIPLFQKWFRYLFLAVLAAAFLWGFGHAAYPNQPFYIRGIEVGLGGVLLSYIMVRFGVLTTVVWHYTVDALYTALLLLRSHNLYFRVSGAATAFVAAAPLLIALGAYLVSGGFASEEGIRNADDRTVAPAPEALDEAASAAEAVRAPEYQPLASGQWLLGVLVAGILLSSFAMKLPSWHAQLRFRGTPAEAQAAARSFLRQQGFHARGYRVAVGTVGHLDAAAGYLINRDEGRQTLIKAFSRTVPAEAWEVRFFKPLQKEEFIVELRPGGRRLRSFEHILPARAPGALPTLAQAEQIASSFAGAQGYDVGAMKLVRARLLRRPVRNDGHFVWEAAPGRDGLPAASPIRMRLEVHTAGDHVSSFSPFFHVPEAQQRAFEKRTGWSSVLVLVRAIVGAGLAGLVLWWLVDFVRHHTMRWKPILLAAAAVAGVTAAAVANALPRLMLLYPTRLPWWSWQAQMVLSLAMSALGMFALATVLFAGVMRAAPITARLAERSSRRAWARDAFWASLIAFGWWAGWGRLQAVIQMHWRQAGTVPWPGLPGNVSDAIPGLTSLLHAPVHALLVAAFIGMAVAMLRLGWNEAKWRPAAVVALIGLVLFPIEGVHSPIAFLQDLLLSILLFVLLGLLIAFILRRNPLAYIGALLLPMLAGAGISWLGLGPLRDISAGILLLAGAVAWLLWLATGAGGWSREAGTGG